MAEVQSKASQVEFRLSQIGQIALTVENLDRAVRFYKDVLGIPFLFQTDGLAFFDCSGIRLMLSEPEDGATDASKISNSVLYYNVADLRESYQILVSRGVAFEDEPHLIADLGKVEVWMCFFRDSESNLVGLMSEIAK